MEIQITSILFSDWTTLYINNKKFTEGHSVLNPNAEDVISHVTKLLGGNVTFKTIEADEINIECNYELPENLKDIKNLQN
jgi:hypothetical protein